MTISISVVMASVMIFILFQQMKGQDLAPEFVTRINWIAANNNVALSFASKTDEHANIEFRYMNNQLITSTVEIHSSAALTQLRSTDNTFLSIIDIRLQKGELVYSTWDSTQCREGPNFEVENRGEESYRKITNTTGQPIYFIDNSAISPSWELLEPQEIYELVENGKSGYIEVRTNLEEFKDCATLIWDFLPKPPQYNGYVINIKDTPMLTGRVYFINIDVSNLTGFRGMSGAIHVDKNLRIIGQSFVGTLSDGMAKGNFMPVDSTNVLTFAVASNNPLSITVGTMFRIDVMAMGDYPISTAITMTNIQFSPAKKYKVTGGNVVFGTQVVSGTVVDFYNHPLPLTNLVISDGVRSAIQGLRNDGTFLSYLQDSSSNFNLDFYPVGYNPVAFQNIQYSLNCIVGMYTCDVESMDVFDDGIDDLEDTICLIDDWMFRPRPDCKVGQMQYEFSPQNFNFYTPGLHNMKVLGRLLGEIIVLKNNRVDTASIKPDLPTVEILGQRTGNKGKVVSLKVSSSAPIDTIGLVFNQELNGSSTEFWYKDHLLLQSNGTNEITAEVSVPFTQTGLFEVGQIYYGNDVGSSEAKIILIPSLPLYLPSVYKN